MGSATSPRPNPEKIQRFADQAKHLTAIKESPSFPVLKEIIEKRINIEMKKVLGTPELSAQQFDYTRGLLYGMRVVLDTVEKGPEQFELVLKRLAGLEEE